MPLPVSLGERAPSACTNFCYGLVMVEDRATVLRAKIAKARRLATGVTDAWTSARLLQHAAELEAALDAPNEEREA